MHFDRWFVHEHGHSYAVTQMSGNVMMNRTKIGGPSCLGSAKKKKKTFLYASKDVITCAAELSLVLYAKPNNVYELWPSCLQRRY